MRDRREREREKRLYPHLREIAEREGFEISASGSEARSLLLSLTKPKMRERERESSEGVCIVVV